MTSLALPHTLHRRVGQVALSLNWSFAEVTRQALHDSEPGRLSLNSRRNVG